VVHACSLSCLGGCGRRITSTQEFETSLDNMVRFCLKKKKKERKRKEKNEQLSQKILPDKILKLKT
jgi:hypothetical protein